jgi:alpha-amylase/alpha-mannosidase (GH57 family)
MEFLFAVHNHQPVGNFPSIFKAAFEACYRPLLTELAAHPGFRFALHFSGPLWEYMEKNERTCWDLIREMAGRNQVELLGGGFYEPVLSLIPEEDRQGQIRMMNEYLGERFGRRPRGLWLTERVWEPDLPRTLAAAGLEFTLLDEEHFHYAGVRKLATTYITESEGRSLRVFPIDKTLRYYIPFRSLEDIEAYLRAIGDTGGTAILGDDGEKFGLWPGTHKWVYDEGWLRKFLAFVEEKNIRTMTFAEYLDSHAPSGRIYLPPASYEEMTEWALEPDDQESYRALKAAAGPGARRFLRAGFFRDFCLKYPEANQLHKRMVFVSREIRSAGVVGEPLADLYRSQCNDPYWHGVFGGLYLPHLREAAYRHLLQAEKALPDPEGWKVLDYDCDGRDELLCRDRTFGLLAKPDAGGTIVEIDYRPCLRNISDVLGRRREAYHEASAGAGEGTGKSIHEIGKRLPPEAAELMRYDRYPKHSLIDHFFRPGTTAEQLRRAEGVEQGDFVDGAYSFAVSGAELRLERRGEVRIGEERAPIAVRKTVSSAGGALRVSVEIENLSERALALTYGSEWNIMAFPHEIEFLGSAGASLYKRALSFEPSTAADVWSFALKTLSQSEGGFDIIHQGYCLCPIWHLEWAGPGTEGLSIVLRESHG